VRSEVLPAVKIFILFLTPRIERCLPSASPYGVTTRETKVISTKHLGGSPGMGDPHLANAYRRQITGSMLQTKLQVAHLIPAVTHTACSTNVFFAI
jgi:hypothetical protein